MRIEKEKKGEVQMIKAIIFDLDGTLLNRDESVKNFIDDQYERFKKWVGNIPKDTYTKRFIELDCRGYVWKDKVYQQLVRELEIEGIDWQYLLQDYISQFPNHCVPFPNVLSMLEKLKKNNLVLGMITNGFGDFQMNNLKALGIEKYFKVILVSEWEGIKKPDPEIFERALKKLQVNPNESIFVGDHPENDVIASRNVGMISIWKKDYQWDTFVTELYINDLAELPSTIEEVRTNLRIGK